jgi:hypothetical protein
VTESHEPRELTRDTFAPHVGSSFLVHADDARRVELTLAQVSDVRTSARTEAFSLEFHGPAGAALPQAEYRFEHPVLGELALFIVPVGQQGGLLEYEAVFNRVLPRS